MRKPLNLALHQLLVHQLLVHQPLGFARHERPKKPRFAMKVLWFLLTRIDQFPRCQHHLLCLLCTHCTLCKIKSKQNTMPRPAGGAGLSAKLSELKHVTNEKIRKHDRITINKSPIGWSLAYHPSPNKSRIFHLVVLPHLASLLTVWLYVFLSHQCTQRKNS